MVVQFTHQVMLYLHSMEPTTSSITQQLMMVVWSMQFLTFHWHSMEQLISETTLHMLMVVQSMQNPIFHHHSLELVILIITQQSVVVQFTHTTMLYLSSMNPTISLAIQHTVMEVLFMQQTTSHCISLEIAASPETLQCKVEPSLTMEANWHSMETLALLTMDMTQEIVVEVHYIWLLIQNSPFHLTQLCVGRTIMQI